jgi:hypothetical protein
MPELSAEFFTSCVILVSLSGWAEAADRGYAKQIEALTKLITAPDRAEIFGDVIGSDADRRFARLGLDHQRTVIETLLRITVHPTGRGRRFDPASLDIAYR